MSATPKIAIIAALERELREFTAGFQSAKVPGISSNCYRHENVLATFAGIGPQAARKTADGVIAAFRPELLVSAGFAGALDPALHAGDIFTPKTVISEKDSRGYRCIAGSGVLVSTTSIAGAEQKARLRDAYNAQAVDMEAFAVAEAAERASVPFLAIKAISDDSAADLPDLSSFVGQDGRFKTLNFIVHLIVHPALWPSVRLLARNSAIAAQNLGKKLRVYMAQGEFERLISSKAELNSR